ncbi:hypothetical protein H7U20_28915 [Rugamonas sp. CCM 8940]|nr:hypothetical protein [Rugamonas sp. CCM 8940]
MPSEYEGVWRRLGIWRSDGSCDLSTRVWWFQAPRLHIDLRIPADRPSLADAAALARLSPEQLNRVHAQTGFAGLTVVDAKRCEWRPEIAFPAVGAELDAGWMRFDSPDHLHETGLDNSYEEDWLREPGGALRGARLVEVASGAIAYLLLNERWMAWACAEQETASRPDRLVHQQWPEFTVLRKHEDWTVEASTLPWLEHTASIRYDTLNLTLLSQWRHNDEVAIPLAPGRRWRVAE